jgi:hypothetical protein
MFLSDVGSKHFRVMTLDEGVTQQHASQTFDHVTDRPHQHKHRAQPAARELNNHVAQFKQPFFMHSCCLYIGRTGSGVAVQFGRPKSRKPHLAG